MSGFQDKLRHWTMSSTDGHLIQEANQHIEHLAEELYCEYEPTKGPYPSFWQRLENWIDCAKTEESQRALFRLLQHVFFVGPKELDSLYRVAYNAHVTRWLIEMIGVSLDSVQLENSVQTALAETWFCPITDSMRINAFYHLNHISGREYRPDWSSLEALGDPTKVDNYIASAKIKHIVLLEDFVGTGTQIDPAVHFAGGLASQTPTLVIPLVICPTGLQSAAAWEGLYPHMTVRPILELRPSEFLSENPVPGEPPDFLTFRQVALDTYPSVLAGQDPVAAKVYTPFGFGGTGAFIVLATNCPDNTLPLIHHMSPTWSGIFPRASRI